MYYFKNKIFKRAKNYLYKYCRICSANKSILFYLGLAYRIIEQYNQAIDVFEMCENANIDDRFNKYVYYENGLAHLLKGNYEYAIEKLYKSLSIPVKVKELDYRISYRLGEAFFRSGKTKKAINHLSLCMKNCPNHQSAKILLNKINNLF